MGKMKAKTSKMIALLLSLLMVLSAVPIYMFSVFAANEIFFVVKDGETAIKGATVTVVSTTVDNSSESIVSDANASVNTDDDGKATFSELNVYLADNAGVEAEVEISVTADGYKPFTDVFTVNAESEEQAIQLTGNPKVTVEVKGRSDKEIKLYTDAELTNEISSGDKASPGTEIYAVPQAALNNADENYTSPTVKPDGYTSENNKYKFTVGDEDLAISFEYKPVIIAVSYSIEGEGDITPNDANGHINVDKTAETTVITFVPGDHYHFVSAELNDDDITDQVTDNKYTIQNSEITNKTSVNAVFKIDTFNLSAGLKEGQDDRGSIELVLPDGISANAVPYNTKITVNMRASNVKYSLVGITVNDVDFLGATQKSRNNRIGIEVATLAFNLTEEIGITLKDGDSVSIVADYDEIDTETLRGVKIADNASLSASQSDDGIYYVKKGNSFTLTLNDRVNYTVTEGETTTTKNLVVSTGFYSIEYFSEVAGQFKKFTPGRVLTIQNSDNISNIQFVSSRKPYQFTDTIKVRFDGTNPTISEIENIGYSNSEKTIDFTVTDEAKDSFQEIPFASGIADVTCVRSYGRVSDEYVQVTVENGSYSINYVPVANLTGDITYTITAVDKVGNKSTKTFTVGNDTIAPTLKENDKIQFNAKEGSVFNFILNTIGKLFGNFVKSETETEIVIPVTDEGAGFDETTTAEVIFQKAVNVSENTDEIQYGFVYNNTENEYENVAYRFTPAYDSARSAFVVDGGLPEYFFGRIIIFIYDKLGNKSSEIIVSRLNSNILEGQSGAFDIMLAENTVPTADIQLNKDFADSAKQYQNENDEIILNGSPVFTVTLSDEDVTLSDEDGDEILASGLHDYTLTVNGEKPESVDINGLKSEGYQITKSEKLKQTVTKLSFDVDVSDIEADEDGAYTISVSVTDNAGNAFETEPYKVYVDTTAPLITGFEFALNDEENGTEYQEPHDGSELAEYVVVDASYGYFFGADTKVTVSFEDQEVENEFKSGIREIVVYLIDKDGNYYSVKEDGALIEKLEESEKPDDNRIAYVGDGEISFVIPADFKGQIYAYAYDNVLNVNSEEDDENNVTIITTSPDGSIVESYEKHFETSAITFTDIPQANGTQNTSAMYSYNGDATLDKVMDYRENVADAKVPLYNTDIEIGVSVEDTFSGIRSVTTTIIEGNKETKETTTIDLDGEFDGEDNGWVIDEENGRDKMADGSNNNLVTKLNKTVEIEGNYNDMVLLVEMEDRSGNTSYDYYVFGIDKTAPTIEVSYDNNAAENGNFFRADRIATVTITERNFNEDDVKWVIENAEGSAPVAELKEVINGTGNGDDTKYIFTIPYTSDGVYSFDVSYTDRATNANDPVEYAEEKAVAANAFVIDKTLPTVSVLYDNNAAANEKYFNAYRTATVTIREHNFDVNQVNIQITSTIDGGEIAGPAITWSDNGDVHVATIAYNSDGDYKFDITMTDKAGNAETEVSYGNSVAAKDFTIDTQISKPIIGGVENGKSYKDEVIPTISLDDVNYSTSTVELLKTRTYDINKNVTAEYIKNLPANRTTVSENFFDIIPENDGLYTLTVTVTDMAGNTESDSVKFTVNRFGSVYVYSEDLIALNDSYVQAAKGNLVIHEYNPDRLVEDSVKFEITRDNAPFKNIDVTTSPVPNNTVAIGDSGWYQYDYTFANSNFDKDGVYTINVASQDEVGNTPESSKDSEILFRVDTTPPDIVSIKGMEKAQVNALNQNVEYSIFDAIGLESVTIEVNGTPINTIKEFTDALNFSGNFTINEGYENEVRLVIRDRAGNETDTASEGYEPAFKFHNTITVSTNILLLWFSNKPLFFGSIGAVVAAAGIAIFLIAKKRRKDEEETKNK